MPLTVSERQTTDLQFRSPQQDNSLEHLLFLPRALVTQLPHTAVCFPDSVSMRGKPRSYKEWKVADDPLVHLDVCTSGGRVSRVLAAANWPGLWRCEMWGVGSPEVFFNAKGKTEYMKGSRC